MIQFFIDNGAMLVTTLVAIMYVFKLIANLTPGLADDGLFKKLDSMFDIIIPNYTSQSEKEDDDKNASK
jgi:hypothetical protein